MVLKDGKLLTQADPWRFVCPECGAYMSQIYRRSGSNAKTTKHGERDDPDAQYYCRGCSTPLRHLYDRRENEEVSVGTCHRSDPNSR